MPGVAIRLPSLRTGSGLADLASRLRLAASQLEPTIDAIAVSELGDAVTIIKRMSPVKTGRYRAGWKLVRRPRLTYSVETDPVQKGRHYGAYVHLKGERGNPFWEAHAQPVVMAAYDRILVRSRLALRELVRVGAAARLAPSLPVVRSLAARGRLR